MPLPVLILQQAACWQRPKLLNPSAWQDAQARRQEVTLLILLGACLCAATAPLQQLHPGYATQGSSHSTWHIVVHAGLGCCCWARACWHRGLHALQRHHALCWGRCWDLRWCFDLDNLQEHWQTISKNNLGSDVLACCQLHKQPQHSQVAAVAECAGTTVPHPRGTAT